jgi:hypothetical protein
MTVVTLGRVSMSVNSELTSQIYSSIASGATSRCGCDNCRNYSAQIPHIFSDEITRFFARCGIDLAKDADIGCVGEVSPGFYGYSGEYSFISISSPSIDADELPGGFEFFISSPSPVTQSEFVNVPGARSFNFEFVLPWKLNERHDGSK